ncbi:MAG: sodium-dependent transporter, partial [Pseudomonadota bacterium]
SLLAAVVVFGTVFAVLGDGLSQAEVLDVMQTSGPAATGLTFIWMPQLFAKMPGGHVLAVLFFLGLSFAAFSSLLSMIQLIARIVTDFGVTRRRAIAGVCTAGFALGVPSAINLGFFANQDFVWGVALMLSGAFVAFAVVRQGAAEFRRETIDGQPGDWNAGRAWDVAIAAVVPLLAVVLLVWWLYQAAAVYAPDDWYNPFSAFSIMTCLVQWGLAIGIFMALNRWMQRRLRAAA